MKQTPFHLVLLCALASHHAGGAAFEPPNASDRNFAAPARPNILFILADDLGYGDVGCYNAKSKIPTPHLDRLAREGMRFTDAHAPSSVCTPTRYALLTGRYAWRSPLQRGVLGLWGTPIIPADRLTVPTLLRQHGHATAAIGKWHLGLNYPTKDGQPAALGGDKLSNVDFVSDRQRRQSWRGLRQAYRGLRLAAESREGRRKDRPRVHLWTRDGRGIRGAGAHYQDSLGREVFAHGFPSAGRRAIVAA
jgi:arylsulfatase A-like enzyme